MPGGDLTTLAMTAPGIRVNVTGGSGNMNANGIPGSTILYTLDGMDQNDPANNLNNSGASNNLLGANGVGEVAIVMNAYSPQYGRMAGAQVNMVGISGANQFHGNLFYNFNFEKLNANSFFDNSSGTRERPVGCSPVRRPNRRTGLEEQDLLLLRHRKPALRSSLVGRDFASVAPAPGVHAGACGRRPASSVSGLFQPGERLARNQPRGPGDQRQRPVAGRQQPPGLRHQQLLQDSHRNGRNHLAWTLRARWPSAPTTPKSTRNSCLTAAATRTYRANQKLSVRYFHDAGVQATGTSPINPLYNSVSNQPSYQVSLSHTWVVTPDHRQHVQRVGLWYTALFGVRTFQPRRRR